MHKSEVLSESELVEVLRGCEDELDIDGCIVGAKKAAHGGELVVQYEEMDAENTMD